MTMTRAISIIIIPTTIVLIVNGGLTSNSDVVINGNLTILPYTSVPAGLSVYSINCGEISINARFINLGVFSRVPFVPGVQLIEQASYSDAGLQE